MAFRPRFFRPPAGSFFLLGPRGTGKTTWLRERVPDALFVNLLRPETYRELTARPERLRELVLGSPGRLDVVVDEVQRVPELLNVVHDLIESPRRSALHSRRPIRTVRGHLRVPPEPESCLDPGDPQLPAAKGDTEGDRPLSIHDS